MLSQHLFTIAIFVGLALSLIFLYPRRKRDPSRLKMELAKNKTDLRPNKKPGVVDRISPEAILAQQDVDALNFDRATVAKSLNAHFNYNGHTWDAFEVLGLPAGAPLKMAESKYAEEIKKVSHKDSKEFLRAALQALRARK